MAGPGFARETGHQRFPQGQLFHASEPPNSGPVALPAHTGPTGLRVGTPALLQAPILV